MPADFEALTWTEVVAVHGSGTQRTIDVDVRAPSWTYSMPVEIPLADAITLHRMLGDAISSRPADYTEGDYREYATERARSRQRVTIVPDIPES